MATLSLPKPVPTAIRGSSLLSFKWNNSYLKPLPSQFKIRNFCRKDSNFTTVQCVNLNSKKCSIIDLVEEEERNQYCNNGFLFENKAVITACFLGLLITTIDSDLALAASGGRIGGKSFPSSSRSSQSGSSSSSTTNYSSSPSYSNSSSSKSCKSSSSSSKSSKSSYSSSPSYSSSYSSKSSKPSYSSSPSGLLFFLFLIFILPFFLNIFSPSNSSSSSTKSSKPSSSSSPSYSRGGSSSSSSDDSLYSSTNYALSPRVNESSGVSATRVIGIMFCIAVGITIGFLIASYVKPLPKEQTSVIKLQVCLLGIARSLQKDLEQLAEVAETSTPEGLNYILKEATLALLRHPDFCISGCSSVDVKQSFEDGEKGFDQLSIEERGKFDEETLFNVNNIKRKMSSRRQKEAGSRNEYIVITILVAAAGEQKFPSITNIADLKEALQKLGSISSSKTMAVEVLWTPQEEDDTLSEQELLEKYPLLKPLHDG